MDRQGNRAFERERDGTAASPIKLDTGDAIALSNQPKTLRAAAETAK